MVVEDEPDIYEVLLAMFAMWSIEGVAFVDGEEATAWIEDVDSGRYRGELPELALLDIRLPGSIKGYHVAQRLRQSAILGTIAIVLITSFKLTSEEYTEIMAISGANDLIYKPLPDFDEFKRQLEAVVARQHAAAPQKVPVPVPTPAPTPAPAPTPTLPPANPVTQDKKD